MVAPVFLRRPAPSRSLGVRVYMLLYARMSYGGPAGRECPPSRRHRAAWYSSESSRFERIRGRSQFRREALPARPTRAGSAVIVPPLRRDGCLMLLASASSPYANRIGHGLDLRAPITQFLFGNQPFATRKPSARCPPKARRDVWIGQSSAREVGYGPNPNEPSAERPDALDNYDEASAESCRSEREKSQ